MGFKKKSGLLVGAGFLLGTVAQGLRAKATYENIVEQAKAEVDDIVAEATYISVVGKDGERPAEPAVEADDQPAK